ncbi:PorP/SprF family type IX secretion system membrane protein [Robertkochia aurantiaca]|uniref:PorP/SprF family type IX secretion system membrane protein n=1 Tax=Robertkochia aurantiaca TaxID=2873700 RepID=UPI001CCFE66D|nr:type IX secretion system membrane protein PorP/SprF [Robertkochia sp. 3YJGBD-33]
MIKRNYTYIATIVLLFSAFWSWGQQLPQFTQYMYNTIAINPAYAGSRESLSFVGLHRSQWSGFGGGPQTLTASVHSPLRNDRIGLGMSVINDQLGYENFSYVYADFSYTIPTGDVSKLSFGIKGGVTQFRLDQEFLTDPSIVNDPFFTDISNRVSPNIGAGVYWHSYRWYIGLSSPRILNTDYNKGRGAEQEFIAAERQSYYLTGGLVIDMGTDVKFKPAFLIKATNGADPSYDTTLNFLFYEKLWLGASYRFDDSIGGIADFQITEQLRLGYAYDYPISDIRPYNSGTHEIFLLFDLKLANPKFKSPRYF